MSPTVGNDRWPTETVAKSPLGTTLGSVEKSWDLYTVPVSKNEPAAGQAAQGNEKGGGGTVSLHLDDEPKFLRK